MYLVFENRLRLRLFQNSSSLSSSPALHWLHRNRTRYIFHALPSESRSSFSRLPHGYEGHRRGIIGRVQPQSMASLPCGLHRSLSCLFVPGVYATKCCAVLASVGSFPACGAAVTWMCGATYVGRSSLRGAGSSPLAFIGESSSAMFRRSYVSRSESTSRGHDPRAGGQDECGLPERGTPRMNSSDHCPRLWFVQADNAEWGEKNGFNGIAVLKYKIPEAPTGGAHPYQWIRSGIWVAVQSTRLCHFMSVVIDPTKLHRSPDVGDSFVISIPALTER